MCSLLFKTPCQFHPAWRSQSCTFLECNNLSPCAYSLFMGNQWQAQTHTCDCNDQRASSGERDLTLSNELRGRSCVSRSWNTLTKGSCQLELWEHGPKITLTLKWREFVQNNKPIQIQRSLSLNLVCWRQAQATSSVLSISGKRFCVWEMERRGGVWRETR